MNRFTGQNIIKMTIALVAITAVCIATYLFLWGKLFPYSPLKPGFTKHELSNVIIYEQHGATFDDYAVVDSYPPTVEKTHKLRFLRKPVLYIFRDKGSYLRRSMTKARFYAYPNGGLAISPWALLEAQEGKISLETYLKHELSHVLLYQHMGLLAAYLYFPRWLLEGIAMYHANQMGTSWYPGKKETYSCISRGNFIDPRDYGTAREREAPLNVRYPIAFIYSEFGYIVENIITNYGEHKFAQYIKRLYSTSQHDRVFKEVFGIDFDNFLLDFKKRAEEFTQGI